MTKDKQELFTTFSKWFPESAAAYCFGLWQKHKFAFKIKKARKSIFGNYTWRDGKEIITINSDLNPYAFTITYLHEVAHLVTRQKFPARKIKPHGKEWKHFFKEIVKPVLTTDTFPPEIIEAVKSYMSDPKASSCSSPNLVKALAFFDIENGKLHLEELANGDWFVFSDTVFRKVDTRRTRVVCFDPSLNKQFLISKVALVSRAEAPAFSAAEVPDKVVVNPDDVLLKSLPNNAMFMFLGKKYIKIELRRTRVLCQQKSSGSKFLIAGTAIVKPIN